HLTVRQSQPVEPDVSGELGLDTAGGRHRHLEGTEVDLRMHAWRLQLERVTHTCVRRWREATRRALVICVDEAQFGPQRTEGRAGQVEASEHVESFDATVCVINRAHLQPEAETFRQRLDTIDPADLDPAPYFEAEALAVLRTGRICGVAVWAIVLHLRAELVLDAAS